jgi:hypothetical protein
MIIVHDIFVAGDIPGLVKTWNLFCFTNSYHNTRHRKAKRIIMIVPFRS